jgi:NhaP-type Na+/H+ or K+/H+ antiporter
MWTFILSIGILVFLSHIFSILFEKIRIPDVLLLMGLGILIGPVLKLITPSDFGIFGNVMTTVALILILFEGGTTLNLSSIKKALLPMSVLTLLSFILTSAICFCLTHYLMGFELFPALMTGSILGGTSSAVVVPMIKSLKVKDPVYTSLLIESALTDVLCIVFTFVLIDASLDAENLNGLMIVWSILSTLIFAAVLGVIGAIIWMMLLRWIRKYPNTMFTTLAFIFILYGVAESMGFSGAITALAFGITLSNLNIKLTRKSSKEEVFTRVNEHEKNFFAELVFLLKTFFFLYLGLSLKFDDPYIYLYGGGITALVLLSRLFISRLSFSKKHLRHDVMIASVMVPKGLAAAVLASVPLSMGIAGAEQIQSLVFSVVLLSIVFTAILVPILRFLPPYTWVFHNYPKDIAESTDNTDQSADDAISQP